MEPVRGLYPYCNIDCLNWQMFPQKNPPAVSAGVWFTPKNIVSTTFSSYPGNFFRYIYQRKADLACYVKKLTKDVC